MKAFLTIILGLAIGLGLAFVFFQFESSTVSETFPADGWPDTGKLVPPSCDLEMTPGDNHLVFESTYSGKIYPRKIGVENVGQVTGEIWIEDVPREIRLLNMSKGSSSKQPVDKLSQFVIEFELVPLFGDASFDKQFSILTSEAENAKLNVRLRGSVLNGIGIEPTNVTFTSKAIEEKKPIDVHMLSWLHNDVNISGTSFSDSSDLFDLEFIELAPEIKNKYPALTWGKTLRVTPKGTQPKSRDKIILSVEHVEPGFAPFQTTIRFGE